MFYQLLVKKILKGDLRGEMARNISLTARIFRRERMIPRRSDAQKNNIPNVLEKLNYNIQSISITNIQC